ncbi:putative DNA binding domain-containing protein [Bifidobacterium sp. ESL0769]|uniref:ATP-binding protein n=1 Tax=Bifidobacterium sp. ESL0769 TaxID=2983229 RepID=UPI0023F7B08C|nr:ATP-binding protein [Bifidobacterium sp. ESL0769]WEV67435.1 putative DNA binding domain-containing protein [Bifidobacterium sp. ESL0769]
MAESITTDQELADAIALMREAGTDLKDYELKEAKGGFPSSAVESIAAFANTNGGVVILGINEKTFAPVTDLDVRKLQSQLAQAARERLQPAVQIDIQVLHYRQSPVLVANVPELDIMQKPCYVKKRGKMDGSYLRTGDGDHLLTLYEIDRFMENQYRVARNDLVAVPDATIDDLDPDLLHQWMRMQRAGSFERSTAMSDEQILINRRVLADDGNGTPRPTIAGICALGSFPQKFFPRLNVVFTSFPTSRKGDILATQRYLDAENIDGPIPAMISGALRAVSRNTRTGAVVVGALRKDIPDYPLPAVREAIANALMHRDYSPEAQGAPVRVELYPDRLEIINPGGLFGPLTVEALERKERTQSRNQFLARILEDTPYTDTDGSEGKVVENRGTGYPIIAGSLAQANMAPPFVESDLDEFRIVFRRRQTQDGATDSATDMKHQILTFLANQSSAGTAEVASRFDISRRTAAQHLNDLRKEGLVEAIGAKNSPKRAYRVIKN